MNQNLTDPASAPLHDDWHTLSGSIAMIVRRFLASNPLYLASAGLFLYGINAVTTDPKFVGAEHSLLQFNFCALVVYELILAVTAIALARRGIWYDALLLVGLANLFVIVPFSLVNRAVYLSPDLALLICIGASVFTALKLWAFKRFIPELNLPRRLLAFGAVLLLVNAVTPARFNAMAEDPPQIQFWLTIICFAVLPFLTALANFLPRPFESSRSPGGKRWVPLVLYLGWIVVTAFHVLGIGYSTGREWSFSLLVPTAWTLAWTVYLRRRDFVVNPSPRLDQLMLLLPLLIPLFGTGKPGLLPALSGLNLCYFSLRLLIADRSRLAIGQFLLAVAIFLCGLPFSWVQQFLPEMKHWEWIVCSIVPCGVSLLFLSRDPRVAVVAAAALAFTWVFDLGYLTGLAPQLAVVFLLIHSLRWEDSSYRGAAILRNSTGLLWLLLTLRLSFDEVQLFHYFSASAVFVSYAAHALHHRSWKPRMVPVYAGLALLVEPASLWINELKDAPAGFVAIGISFLLFGLGSLIAFTKSKWYRPLISDQNISNQ